MTAALPEAAGVDAPEWDRVVAAFLRANPGWLAAHGDLYRVLTPPNRVHGEVLADHMAAMVVRERRQADTITSEMRQVLAAGRATAIMLARVQEAVLGLMIAHDPVEFICSDMPRLLGADVAGLWLRSRGDERLGGIETLLGRRDVMIRSDPPDAFSLYREGGGLARHDALIRLPGIGVAGIASRDRLWPECGQAQPGLQFLGRAIAAVLRS